jgi:polysaccharide biosynthesis protein PslH
MRILWAKMGGLWPTNSGGRTRSLQIITELARRHEVTVVTTHGDGDDPEGLAGHLSSCARVISFAYQVPKRGSAAFPMTVARSWLSRDPVDLWKWRVADVRQSVAGLIDSGRIDVCVADFLFAVSNVPMGGRVPTVLFEHNVEYLIWKRLADLERVPWRRAQLAPFERERRRPAATSI